MLYRGRKLRRMAPLCWMPVVFAVTLYSQPSVLTWHNDNFRTGQNLQETILTPSNVNVSSFGKLFTIGVDGKVDGQPLYVPGLTIPGQGVHNVLYLATEHDSVYAFDADNGALLKHVSLLVGTETTSDVRSCSSQVSPEIGITATPVIDPQSGPHGTIYVVAMTKDTAGGYHHRLHALDLTTLSEEFNGPVEVVATFPGSTGTEKKNAGDGVQTFLPAQHKDRAALLISNGIVYTSWSSHCDIGPYTSWVIGYNESTLAQTTVLNLVPNGRDGGIWGAGSGPQADGAGNVYIPTGNGTFDTTLLGNGFPSQKDFGNAYVKMSTSGGALAVADYFTMSNTVSETAVDADLGSGGGMLLPTLLDAGGHARDLAVVAGKDTNIYVMDRTNLGKFNPSANEMYQQLTGVLAGGVWSSPAWFNNTLYYGAQGNVLKAFPFANGRFNMNPASQSSATFQYPGTTPSISANGSSNGIVWAAGNGNAVLHAYAANNLGNELYNSNQNANGRDRFGVGNKFVFPTIVNGKVYVSSTGGVANQPGSVAVFGLLAGPLAPVSVSPNSGSGSAQTFTFTFTDANGATDIASTQMDLGGTLSVAGSCFFYYAVGSNSIYLEDDTGVSHAPLALGAAGTAQNSQCMIDASASSVSKAGSTLTVNLAVAFMPAYVGAKNIYAIAQSATQSSGWVHLGAWTVTSNTPPPPPAGVAAVSVSPNAGSGSSQTFAFSFSDTNGAGDIGSTQIDIGGVLAVAHSCFFYYAVGANAIYLEDDTGVSHAPLTLGSAGTAQNSQCTIDAGASSVSMSGNTLTVNLALSFLPGYAGAKNVYALAQNASVNSGWTQLGTWTVTGNGSPPPPPSPPAAVSVSPNAGSGLSQTFAFSFTDSSGAGNILSTQMDIGGVLAVPNSCFFYYAVGSNSIYLEDDTGVSHAPLTLGSAGTAQNSQCRIDAGASSLSMAGNTLTVNLALSFLPGYAGAKNVFMFAQNSALNSGWVNRGTWTVP
jgi:hypothetical protein